MYTSSLPLLEAHNYMCVLALERNYINDGRDTTLAIETLRQVLYTHWDCIHMHACCYYVKHVHELTTIHVYVGHSLSSSTCTPSDATACWGLATVQSPGHEAMCTLSVLKQYRCHKHLLLCISPLVFTFILM